MKKEVLHIATFNIHGAWGTPRDEIGSTLRALSLDVICLQECSIGAADALCSMLGASWSVVVAPAAYLANAILTPHRIREEKSLVLCTDGEEGRSAALAKIAFGAKKEAWVCSTHLDHRSEVIRIAQWNSLQNELASEHILCGDLNALGRGDYGIAAWNEITQIRARNHWELPFHELMDKVYDAGYRDSWRHGENAGHPPMTSRFDTRIDYILLSPAFPGRFVPCSHRCIDTREARLSDHSMVVARVFVDDANK